MVSSTLLTFALLAINAKFSGSKEVSHLNLNGIENSGNLGNRELTFDRPACAADIEMFLAIDQECPMQDREIKVDLQTGNIILKEWVEGTGGWTKFMDFTSERNVPLLEKGKHTINVCFYSTEYLAFKSMTIGEEHMSPTGDQPLVIQASKYDSFVDVDMTSNGHPTIVQGKAVGYIHSGESLQYEIHVKETGWYPITYTMSRSCEDRQKPKPPRMCKEGGVVCGDYGACCMNDEKCYLEGVTHNRELIAGVVSRELTFNGSCCPLANSCARECCQEGFMCDEGRCKEVRNEPEIPVCGNNQYNCGINSCCGNDELCYLNGMSGPISHRALYFEETRKLTEGSCCPDDRSCPLQCCPEGQECVDGSCKRKGCPLERSCPNECCPHGSTCVHDMCVEGDYPTPAPTSAPFALANGHL